MHDPGRNCPTLPGTLWASDRKGGGKTALYQDLIVELDSLLRGETDPVANAANTAAAIFHSLPDLNWVGFYFVRGDELVLGPFQGKPACVPIPLGNGVCGTAAAERRSVRVADVHEFPGHIACDAASRSELVVPLLTKAAAIGTGATGTGPGNESALGVLDLDSPLPGRFDVADQLGCESIAALLVRHPRGTR
jgi:L-methionine (R)-S-oxide reductase